LKVKAELFPHQEIAIAFAERKKYSILGLEQGLGKTLCSLALAVNVRAKNILIVVPAFLRTNWEAEIEKFTEGLTFTIVSYSQLAKVDSDSYDFLIADECHYLKNSKTKRSKYFEMILKASKPNYLVLLSGTPIKNRVGEFWNLLRLVHYGGGLPEFDNFSRKNHHFKFQHFKFQYYFSNAVTQYFGHRQVTKFEGMRNIPELTQLANAARLRMKSRDVINLPETTNIDVKIKETSKFDKDFKELMTKDLEVNHESYMLIKKNNAIAKCDYTIKLASEIVENGQKVIIFSDHVNSVHKIAGELGTKAICGKVAPVERARRVSAFEQSREPLALVATIGSLSVGVNLTSASYMIFNDLPFVPADLDQAKKRIHRIGQSRKCFYYYVYISDLDRKLQNMIYSKRKVIEKL
jgi:SNF2 family DNA or RNA helicase